MAKSFGNSPRGIRAKKLRKNRGKSETGKSKKLVPLPSDRAITKASRSYKWPEYEAWCIKMDKKK